MLRTDYYDLKVLYVEDEDFVREPFSEMLRRRVKEVIVARDGIEGLERFKQEKPDLVISDIKMPVMDGLTMTKEIKAINPYAPVIITTAFEFKDYLMKAIEVGVNKYLVKPIDRNSLLTALDDSMKLVEFIRNTRAYQEFIQMLFEYPNRTIVLVDPSKLERVNSDFLQFFGFKTREDFFSNHLSITAFFESIHDKQFSFDQQNDVTWIDSFLKLNGIENNTFINSCHASESGNFKICFRLFKHDARLAFVLHSI
jgi:CheY-like chemotaxis protein